MSAALEQPREDDPRAIRRSENYQQEYVHSFVDKWDELIDWD
ncbi:MAG: class I SAM-dependent methyltransferase, partial [Gammaproteobacteria bacterium]|nr:class I SAM-dependent methyltransferase [Gammaproteobacteria bacterium]